MKLTISIITKVIDISSMGNLHKGYLMFLGYPNLFNIDEFTNPLRAEFAAVTR